jgi:hypothetical protein
MNAPDETTNRWHNILGGFDWSKIKDDFADLHKRAEDAGLELTIIDNACPCCGFRPCFVMKERREKKQGRPPKQLPLI